ncbi:LAQU0S03e09868g1_1 [Lachancea quebecensis]|uniref:Phosphoinositide phospholipase C n=1 Tax=Lachancea quebecensis TaxID=1654605 RepID=A0A0P1KP41_9SACH|nr:LAQU0S03e09868g1_1 [Lachancea quebecensis]
MSNEASTISLHGDEVIIGQQIRPEPWARSANESNLVLLDRNCIRYANKTVKEGSLQRSMKNSFRRILRRTTDYMPRSKAQKSPNFLGPMTYDQAYLSRNVEKANQFLRNENLLKDMYHRLQVGIRMTKITRKKQVDHIFTINDGVLSWRESKNIDLDTIKDVRCGEMAKNYIEDYKAPPSTARLWVTIIYQVSSKFRALHVVAPNSCDLECFYLGIVNLVDSRRNLMKSIKNPEDDMFANIHWHASVSPDKYAENVEVLSFNDVKTLCSKFNIFCSDAYLKEVFDLADANSNGLLNFKEFQRFVKMLKQRKELSKIWLKITNGKATLTLGGFSQFIRKVQQEDVSPDILSKEFDKFKHDSCFMKLDGFQKYLTSQPYLHDINMDYSMPINKYFISSSHNTYLQGKQLGESPTVETYIHALQQGCRCIEIDIWDGDDGPVVRHGKLTGYLPLQNVIRVVRKYAFMTSPYPLILSLEIHCKPANQLVTEHILRDLLGDKIHHDSENGRLFSPSQLKHKYLIKVKKSRRSVKLTFDDESTSSTSASSSYDSELDCQKTTGRSLNISKKTHVIESLVEVSAIYGVKFRNFSLPESKAPNHCFSLNEKKLDNLGKDETQKLAIDKHNRRFLMRVYPHALRYKSSNFNPIRFWEVGVQMVATNWQTYDLGQQLNKAMFQLPLEESSLWHSGYVLKPSYLAHDVNKTNELGDLYATLKNKRTVLSIEIISAQLLPKPKTFKQKPSSFNFSVKLEVHSNMPVETFEVLNGVATGQSSGSTAGCKDNGFTPTWGTLFKMTVADTFFNFLLFTVKAGDTDLATCCLKVDYLRKGYRHVPLYSGSGERFIFSTLFLGVNYYNV